MSCVVADSKMIVSPVTCHIDRPTVYVLNAVVVLNETEHNKHACCTEDDYTSVMLPVCK